MIKFGISVSSPLATPMLDGLRTPTLKNEHPQAQFQGYCEENEKKKKRKSIGMEQPEVSPLNLPPVRKVNEMFNGKYTRIQLEAQSSGKLGINVG